MSSLCQVTVLYGENKLQQTIKLDSSTTVTKAKQAASMQILKHLRSQPGVPSPVTLDGDCTDFYPAGLPDDRIGDLGDNTTIVVWPSSSDGSPYTPSPIMDALNSATTELAGARARLCAEDLIKADKQPKKQRQKHMQGSPSIPFPGPENSMLEDILSRLANLEGNNAELRESNTELRESNAELWESNAKLRESNATLKHDLQTTMQAVIGDRIAINKIRNRVLLDIGRDRLAVVCGHKDWKDWKVNSASRDEMIESVSIRLSTPSNDLPHKWMALRSRPTALRRLLLPNPVRSRGNIAAHASAKQHIGESVLALVDEQEREDMIALFEVVFGEELAH